MKMLEVDIQEILTDMMPKLNNGRIKLGKQKSTWTGAELLAKGIKRDHSGRKVKAEKGYGISIPILGTVNHEKSLRQIIKEACTFNSLKYELKKYLIEHQKPEIKLTMWEEFKQAAKDRKEAITVKRLENLQKVVEKYDLKIEKITEYHFRLSKVNKPTVDYYPQSGKFNVMGTIKYEAREMRGFLTLIYS